MQKFSKCTLTQINVVQTSTTTIERAYTLSCKPQADRRWAGKGRGVTGQRGGGAKLTGSTSSKKGVNK